MHGRAAAVATISLVLLTGCGGAGTETPVATPDQDVNPAACFAPSRTGTPRVAGGAGRLELGTLERHTDVSEVVLIGTVVQRTVFAQAVHYDDLRSSAEDPPPTPGSSVLVCAAEYDIRVSRVLKNTRPQPVSSQIAVQVAEGEAYPSEGYLVKLASAYSSGDRLVWFLLGAGEGSTYHIIGPQLGLGPPVPLVSLYSHEREDLQLQEVIDRVSARASAAPFSINPLDLLETPLP